MLDWSELIKHVMVLFSEFTLKYFELIVAVAVLVLGCFWFKNSLDGSFPYEPTLVIVAGLIPLADSLRRFGFFSKVCFSTGNPKITPWGFSGGKVDKSDISVELIIENKKEQDLLIRSVEIHTPGSVTNVVGEQQSRIRLVDMEKIDNDAFLPMNIPAKSSKTIWVESKHDASSIEKYTPSFKNWPLKADRAVWALCYLHHRL